MAMFDFENATTEDIAVEVLNVVFSNIDFTNMQSQRKMKIWDEFKSKVVSSANTTNDFNKFVDKLCKKFEIANIDYGNTIAKISKADKKLQQAVLKEYRENLTIVMLFLRMKREEIREGYNNASK